jgi:hypothetical protein
MSKLSIAVALLVAASCSSQTVESTSSPPTTTTSLSTTSTIPETTTTAPAIDCPPAPYELTALPFGVGQGLLDPDDIEPDVWTSVGGTNTTFLGRSDGSVAIAVIRGALPAVDWPGDRGEVSIDGTRAVAGSHPDGTWVVGWFEAPQERCDLYTMVFYPPVAPSEVEETLAGITRIAG